LRWFLFFFFFQDSISQTVCLGWLLTSIFLISASRVGRITDKSGLPLAITRDSQVGITGFLSASRLIFFPFLVGPSPFLSVWREGHTVNSPWGLRATEG
jgi:hypothetical protein